MTSLLRGQKVKLADLTPALQLKVALLFSAPGLTFDFSCFGVDPAGKLADDRYFVFYNQKSSPNSEITMSGEGDFSLDLSRLPASIQKLVFVATIDGNGTLANLKQGSISFAAGSSDFATFAFTGSDFSEEKAIMVAEIYLKDVWRLAAVGQGFAGGLDAVLKHFGGQQIEEPAPLPPVAMSKAPAAPALVSKGSPVLPQSLDIAPSQLPKVVSLKKSDSSVKIDLNKTAGEIVATAIWIDNGDRRSDNDDLDLRAGILFPDGSMGIVTCNQKGSLQKKPYISHQGDVKSASRAKPGQETVTVNAGIGEKYGGDIAIVFSIYSAIANGPVAIASLQPQMKLQYGDQVVECKIDFSANHEAKKKFVYTYVIGLAIIKNGQIEISPGGQVSSPSSEATPWLQWDKAGGVQLTMDGPAVLKGGGKILAGLLNSGNKKKYVQL